MEKTLMDNQNMMPYQAQPINRISSGQLPVELTELSEEALFQLGVSSDERASSSSSVLASIACSVCYCSYDGDNAE